MVHLSYVSLRRPLALLVCLVCAAALLTGSRVADESAGQSLRVLQMNLCNSGIASCYTGRSVAEAAAVIRAHAPDLVTLNEICEPDVAELGRALVDVHRGWDVVWEFQAARDGRTGEPYRCRNGQRYGIGLIARLPAPDREYAVHRGTYPTQDINDPEQRAWLCLSTAAFDACTTHLAYTSAAIALAQCHHLFGTAIPGIRASGADRPMVLGGDLNLRYGGTPDLRTCLPPGHVQVDDGGVQQVVATGDVAVRSRQLVDMDRTTDHPSLLVTLAVAGHRWPVGAMP